VSGATTRSDRNKADMFSSLPSIAEDTVLATLRERYLASQPYTALSPCAIVSVNPYVYQPINGDQSLQAYLAEYFESAVTDSTLRDGGDVVKEQLGPHLFRLAFSAYYNMRRTRQDQVIVTR
jgi:chitin synthase